VTFIISLLWSWYTVSFRIPHPLLLFLSFFIGLHKKTGRQKEVYQILFLQAATQQGGTPPIPRVHYRSHTIDLLEVRPAGECSRARECAILALRCVNVAAADGLGKIRGVSPCSGHQWHVIRGVGTQSRNSSDSTFFPILPGNPPFFYSISSSLLCADASTVEPRPHLNSIAQRHSRISICQTGLRTLFGRFVIWSTFSTCDIQRRHDVHFLTEFRTSKEDDRRYFLRLSIRPIPMGTYYTSSTYPFCWKRNIIIDCSIIQNQQRDGK
jgi:hypothetical protein